MVILGRCQIIIFTLVFFFITLFSLPDSVFLNSFIIYLLLKLLLCVPRSSSGCLSPAEDKRCAGENRTEGTEPCAAGTILLLQLSGGSLVPTQRQSWT